MAERVGFAIEIDGAPKAQSALDGIGKSVQGLYGAITQGGGALSGLGGSFLGIGVAAASGVGIATAAIGAVREAAKLAGEAVDKIFEGIHHADVIRDLQAATNAIAGGGEAGAVAFERLYKGAEATRVTGAELVTLFNQIAPLAKNMGFTGEMTQNLAVQLAQAAPAMGRTVEEAFTQMRALLIGRVRGAQTVGFAQMLGLDAKEFAAGQENIAKIIPKLKEFSEAGQAMGQTFESTGKKVKEALFDAFAGGFNEARGAVNEGLAGVIAAFKDPQLLQAIRDLGKLIAELLPIVAAVARGVVSIIKGLTLQDLGPPREAVDEWKRLGKLAGGSGPDIQSVAEAQANWAKLRAAAIPPTPTTATSAPRAAFSLLDDKGALKVPTTITLGTPSDSYDIAAAGLKSVEKLSVSMRQKVETEMQGLMKSLAGMDLAATFRRALTMDPTTAGFAAIAATAEKFVKLNSEAKIWGAVAPTGFEKATATSQAFSNILQTIGFDLDKQAATLSNKYKLPDLKAMFATALTQDPSQEGFKIAEGVAKAFDKVQQTANDTGKTLKKTFTVESAQTTAFLNAVQIINETLKETKAQGDAITKAASLDVITKDWDTRSTTIVEQSRLLAAQNLDLASSYTRVGKETIALGDEFTAMSPQLQALALSTGKVTLEFLAFYAAMKKEKIKVDVEQPVKDAQKAMDELGDRLEAVRKQFGGTEGVSIFGDPAVIAREAAMVEKTYDDAIKNGLTIDDNLKKAMATLDGIIKGQQLKDISLTVMVELKDIQKNEIGDLLADAMTTGGKNAASIIGTAMDSSAKSLAKGLVSALGVMLQPSTADLNVVKTATGDHVFFKGVDFGADTPENRAKAKQYGGEAAAQLVASAAQGFMTGFASPKTTSDLEVAATGIGTALVTGITVGFSTGAFYGAVIGAVAAIVGKLLQPSVGADYKYATFGIDNGQAFVTNAKNMSSLEIRKALEDLQANMDGFWNGYLKILLKFPHDTIKTFLDTLTKTFDPTVAPEGFKSAGSKVNTGFWDKIAAAFTGKEMRTFYPFGILAEGQTVPKTPATEFQYDVGAAASAHFMEHMQDWAEGKLPKLIAQEFEPALEASFKTMGVTAEKFAQVWTKAMSMDPAKGLQYIMDYADAIVTINDAMLGIAKPIGDVVAELEKGQQTTFAAQLKESDAALADLASGVALMTGQAQVDGAKQVGQLLADRYKAEQDYLKTVMATIKQIDAAFHATIDGWVMEGMKTKLGKVDFEGQISFLRTATNDLIQQLKDATSPEAINSLSQQILSNIGQIKSIAASLGPDVAEAYRQWAIETAKQVQSVADAKLHALADEIRDANTALLGAIGDFITAFELVATDLTDAASGHYTPGAVMGKGIVDPNSPEGQLRQAVDEFVTDSGQQFSSFNDALAAYTEAVKAAADAVKSVHTEPATETGPGGSDTTRGGLTTVDRTRTGGIVVGGREETTDDKIARLLAEAQAKALRAAAVSIKDSLAFFSTPVQGPGAGGRGRGLFDEFKAKDAETFVDSMRAADEQILKLADSFDGLVGQDKVDAAMQLNQLLADKQAKEEAFLRSITAAIDSINASFKSQISDWKMEGMKTSTGAPDYAAQAKYLRDQTEELRQQMMASTNPQEIQNLSSQILANIGRIKGLGEQMGPATGEAYRVWAIAAAEKVQKDATDRLTKLGKDVEDANKKFVASLGDLAGALENAAARVEALYNGGTGAGTTTGGAPRTVTRGGRTATVAGDVVIAGDVTPPGDTRTTPTGATTRDGGTGSRSLDETNAQLKKLVNEINATRDAAAKNAMLAELKQYAMTLAASGTADAKTKQAALEDALKAIADAIATGQLVHVKFDDLNVNVAGGSGATDSGFRGRTVAARRG